MQKRVLAGTAAAIAAAVSFIAPWEGLRTKAYPDIVGVWTVCYGETHGVKPGDQYSKAQCDQMLGDQVAAFAGRLNTCIDDDIEAVMPQGMKVALYSWSYNVGTFAACGSTLMRKANAGDLVGACNELPRWNRAGGRAVPGLSNRRAAEQKLCLSSLEITQ
ncbi:lysozyme [Pelagimonas varians]|uniref:Lysozyme n=1 Tax=Pelagimonas varians TaxID=696760 RepID=A0A238KCT9_9RHOB|nr:lysozyme [Pelagimonas varians]PYG29960.1 lysozyme [Pelagimonas varians]SMX40640.1 Lysozyme RrrD [Pelagimonas varians]